MKDEKFAAKCVVKWGLGDKCGITLMALGGICIRTSFQPKLFLASQKNKHKNNKIQHYLCIEKLFSLFLKKKIHKCLKHMRQKVKAFSQPPSSFTNIVKRQCVCKKVCKLQSSNFRTSVAWGLATFKEQDLCNHNQGLQFMHTSKNRPTLVKRHWTFILDFCKKFGYF